MVVLPIGTTVPTFKVGERIRLIVREPNGHVSAKANHPGNYNPQHYVALIEKVIIKQEMPQIVVRWHLPKSFGYKTRKGTTSTLIYIENGVWLETRKHPRNVVAVIEKITEEEYKKLVKQAENS